MSVTGPAPQSALQVIALRQVHSPVVEPGHVTLDGLSRTVHVGGGMHAALTVVLNVPPGPVAVNTHEAPLGATASTGADCGTPSGHGSETIAPLHTALHDMALRQVHCPVTIPGHATEFGVSATVHVGGGTHEALAVVFNVPPGPIALN